MSALDLSRLHTNQRLLVQELLDRGAEIEVIDTGLELLRVHYKGRKHYLLDRATKETSFLAGRLAADKHLSKQILNEHGIPVPGGDLFTRSQADEIEDFAQTLGFPVVLKPNVGSHGFLIRSDIRNSEELSEALDMLLQDPLQTHFIVEEHITGNEYRIFITTKGDYAVIWREPAHVVGDGRRTIRTLAEEESAQRQKLRAQQDSALCPIALDTVAESFLRRQGLHLDYVPRAEEKIYLRPNSNLAQGGVSRDMTELVHPSVLEIARKALNAFDGLPCIGIDFLSPDIGADQSALLHAVIEVNANPGLAMHHMPGTGAPRNVAAYLADVLFR